MCSGKIYWELLAERTKLSDTSTAIVRVEQLYPLPTSEIVSEISKHPNAQLLWVQDEPANQGPWPFISANLVEHLGGRTLRRVSRRASASPATGSIYVHEEEQKALIAEAFAR
jgi:2-oxoglutarate decarboxylase